MRINLNDLQQLKLQAIHNQYVNLWMFCVVFPRQLFYVFNNPYCILVCLAPMLVGITPNLNSINKPNRKNTSFSWALFNLNMVFNTIGLGICLTFKLTRVEE